MTRAVVAIVGRTNVGKSTLLNRLAGRRIAVVADLPGTTRDRVFAFASWRGQELTLVDTGGWQTRPGSSLEEKVRQQVEAAVAQADVIIFVVDAKDGALAADVEIADMLRVADKPVILAVNKIDSEEKTCEVADFYRLAIGEPIPISAYHNRGIDRLMEAVLNSLPRQAGEAGEAGEAVQAKLAIVGRPNVGKSTLLNVLLGDERAIVHESPGTTRDSLDAIMQWGDKRVLLVDTAGIRRRGRVEAGVEYYSLIRAIQAINRCDVALLVIDASEFITAQDLHIASYIMEVGKGIMLLVNKWDLVAEQQKAEFRQKLGQRLRFAPYVPVLYISAKLRQDVDKILPLAWEIWQERQKRVPDSEVEQSVEEAVSSHAPPRVGLRRLRIIRAYQHESQLATFVVEVNDPELVTSPYQRYLENRLRQRFGFRGVPLKLVFTRTNRRSDRKTGVRA